MNKPLIVWTAHEGNLSGANIALLEYINALSEEYCFHIILPHSGSMCSTLEERSVGYSVIPQYGWAGNRISSLNGLIRFNIRSWIALKRTRKLFSTLKASMVFTNCLVSFISAKAAYVENIPHVWWIHEFGEEDFGFSIGLGNKAKAYEQMQKWSRLIVCNSKSVALKHRQLMPCANIQVNYQPVSFSSMNFASIQKKGYYLMFGQISPSKGHIEVIDAIARAKRHSELPMLHIIGPCENDSYYNELITKIKQDNLENIIKIERGFFKKEEVLPQFDVLILASRSEAFGRVIVEAGKAGLRVVVKNSGGAPELINNSNGLLYNSVDELTDIFLENIKLPKGEVKMNYSEEESISQIKKTLSLLK